MERISATELATHTGHVIDRTLHSGPLVVTVRGYAACVLAHPSQVPVEVPVSETISATELFRHTSENLETARHGQCLRVTRHSRPVMLMLPIRLARELGMEV